MYIYIIFDFNLYIISKLLLVTIGD